MYPGEGHIKHLLHVGEGRKSGTLPFKRRDYWVHHLSKVTSGQIGLGGHCTFCRRGRGSKSVQCFSKVKCSGKEASTVSLKRLLPIGSEQHEVLLFGSLGVFRKEYFRLVTK